MIYSSSEQAIDSNKAFHLNANSTDHHAPLLSFSLPLPPAHQRVTLQRAFLEVRNRIRRVLHACGNIPILNQTRPHHSPNTRNNTNAQLRVDSLEVDSPPAGAIRILACEDALQLYFAPSEHGSLDGDGQGGAIAGDLGRVVDEVLGGVGVIACGDVVLDEDFVGEGREDAELFLLGGVRLGG